MSNFYEKKQAEIQEEVDYLFEEKKNVKRESNLIYEKMLELESELSYLVGKENAIIDRLNSIRDSGAKFYGIDVEMSSNHIYGPYSINHTLEHIKSLSYRFNRKVDGNE